MQAVLSKLAVSNNPTGEVITEMLIGIAALANIEVRDQGTTCPGLFIELIKQRLYKAILKPPTHISLLFKT